MATLRSMRRLRGRWDQRGYVTDRRPHLPSSNSAVALNILKSDGLASDGSEGC
jgi:hypothetical protein